MARILKKHDAPFEMVAKFVNLIEDEDSKLGFAKENNMQNLFIEVIVFLIGL